MESKYPFIVHETEEAYRAGRKENLSSHALADFRRCPALYWKKREGIIQDHDRPAYFVGRAAHKLILEGRTKFEATYVTGGPVNPKTQKPFGKDTKAFEEWAKAQGKPCISDEDLEVIGAMYIAVKQHAGAQKLLARGVAEGVARTVYKNRKSQIRLDWFDSDAGIVDLKTCDDLDWFEADAQRYEYAHQMAFYRAVLEIVTGRRFPVHLIAVEKREPMRVGVWQASEATLNAAQSENEQAIARLLECERRCEFPTGFEETRVFGN